MFLHLDPLMSQFPDVTNHLEADKKEKKSVSFVCKTLRTTIELNYKMPSNQATNPNGKKHLTLYQKLLQR